MRLKTIKLSGFKSFVDPSVLHLPSHLIGIVGPNGCGKSNIIDAVRWVMGESSAKHLRGKDMTDVIFNGSRARKPVGKAQVELVFDNSDGRAGGEFGKYQEISIRRTVNRESVSTYYLNGSRCRRRDIVDLFLGTGLGPRSYAIIEQGMISKLIEAKPEELRNFLEEAAGISKYKERRRETENRIQNTKENLERLSDIRDEMSNQLARLAKQSESAKRYKELKRDEKNFATKVAALNYQSISVEHQQAEEDLKRINKAILGFETDLQEKDSAFEEFRIKIQEQHQIIDDAHKLSYESQREISVLESEIKMIKQQSESSEEELKKLSLLEERLQEDLKASVIRLRELNEKLVESEPRFNEKEQEQTKLQQQQQSLEHHEKNSRQVLNAIVLEQRKSYQEVERSKGLVAKCEYDIEASVNQKKKLAERIQELQQSQKELQESATPVAIESLESKEGELSQKLEVIQLELKDKQIEIENLRKNRHELESLLREKKGRLSSLGALQEAALGKNDGKKQKWLGEHGLAQQASLTDLIQSVEKGYESVVELVLNDVLEAVMVDELGDWFERLKTIQDVNVRLINEKESVSSLVSSDFAVSLASKVNAHECIKQFLQHVFCAEDEMFALLHRKSLLPHQFFITPEGMMIGQNWIAVKRDKDPRRGVLERKKDIEAHQKVINELTIKLDGLQKSLTKGLESSEEIDALYKNLQNEKLDVHRELSKERAAKEARLSKIQQFDTEIAREQQRIQDEIHALELKKESLSAARAALENALEVFEKIESNERVEHKNHEVIQASLAKLRETLRAIQAETFAAKLEVETLQRDKKHALSLQERMTQDLEMSGTRRKELTSKHQQEVQLMPQLELKLQGLLERKQKYDQDVDAKKDVLHGLEALSRKVHEERQELNNQFHLENRKLERGHLAIQKFAMMLEKEIETLQSYEISYDDAIKSVEETDDLQQLSQELKTCKRQIELLGPVNLMAIQEFEEESERKEYLDRQHEDLVSALDMLVKAIEKIDHETKARFKETFDAVNTTLGQLFPKVFGGGHAELSLVGDDLLDAGVSIIARPPGKRNSSIQLLSGGEKALTAIALVFAIFQLNPSPFCMLDEVDAPLDDANVGRYCQLIREMSEKVQFVFITHNKITMEMASQLAGVTAKEAGVSRLVAVDVDQAYKMATS